MANSELKAFKKGIVLGIEKAEKDEPKGICCMTPPDNIKDKYIRAGFEIGYRNHHCILREKRK